MSRPDVHDPDGELSEKVEKFAEANGLRKPHAWKRLVEIGYGHSEALTPWMHKLEGGEDE